MIDYAERIAIPKPRPVVGIIGRIIPWFAAAAIGFVLGLAQGAIQSDNHWTKKIIERSHVDQAGIALPVYKDQGQVYYVHRESRP